MMPQGSGGYGCRRRCPQPMRRPPQYRRATQPQLDLGVKHRHGCLPFPPPIPRRPHAFSAVGPLPLPLPLSSPAARNPPSAACTAVRRSSTVPTIILPDAQGTTHGKSSKLINIVQKIREIYTSMSVEQNVEQNGDRIQRNHKSRQLKNQESKSNE